MSESDQSHPYQAPGSGTVGDAVPAPQPAPNPPSNAAYSRRLDRIEQTLVGLAYAAFVVAMVRSVLLADAPEKEILGALLALIAEGIVFVFVMIRRPSEHVTPKPFEWFLAVGATLGPLFVRPIEHVAAAAGTEPEPNPLLVWGIASLLLGLIIQIGSKIVLGRSFGILPAHRGLVRSGPYRFVRHPIYAGYAFYHAGFLLLWPTYWNLGVLVISWVMQILRLLAEERWLAAADPEYKVYQQEVPYRLIPGVF